MEGVSATKRSRVPSLFSQIAHARTSAVTLIAKEIARHYPMETGGLLVGYWPNEHEVIVTGIIGPGPKAKHSTNSFFPDNRWQRRELARVYARSGRRVTYLGDWHSHPNGNPSPSRQDAATAKTIASYPAARCPRPLIFIIGCDRKKRLDIRSYLWSSDQLNACNLVIGQAENGS